MKDAVIIADCSAPWTTRVVPNILAFLFVLAMALVAGNEARAEEPACTGIDMLAQLAKENPPEAEAIKRDAAATPNGKGLLWKLEKQARPASFLFGTMHVTDPRVVNLPSAAMAAYDASATVAIETTDVLDPSAMMAVLMEKPELTMFTDGTTLTSLLSAEDAKAVDTALAARGIPLSSVARMKPWVLAAMVALPPCEIARKTAGAPMLDIKLAQEAKASSKTLVGLETAEEQLEAMASLPIDFHIQGLVETLKLGDRMDDVIETMIVLYLSGDTGMYWPLFRAVFPSARDDQAGYAAFEEKMITARNRTMARNAEPVLLKGNTFIAVGALHLPGPEGLVELFRKAGYKVTAVE